MKIKSVDAYQVFDSRGTPALEAEVELENGTRGRATVPSGASTGRTEAKELRDRDESLFGGMSVFRAVESVRQVIGPALIGRDVGEQEELDELMIGLDGSPDKSNLGANAILGASMALARTAANALGKPLFDYIGRGEGCLLPLPEIQIIGGGAHSGGRIDIQDFMIICTGADDFEKCLEMTHQVYRACGELLRKSGRLAGVADEGGYWPLFDSHREVFELMLKAIEKAGYTPGREVVLALDIAASEFYSEETYHLGLEGKKLNREEFFELICNWCSAYPVASIEDPFAETDRANWKRFTALFGERIQVVGDDLFTTDVERVREGYQSKLANSVLIKPNQIGTVSETFATIRQTQQFGWVPVVSARSGETEDAFIAHLAVATNAGQLKVGSFSRSERMVKWNEVIRIGRELGGRARFQGAAQLPEKWR